VVIGHSLSKQDVHIIQALNDSPHRRRIAVSIYPGLGPHQIVAEKGRIQAALPGHRVSFFDSTTHPLGDPALRVP
jgi:hypothetical protein